MKTIHHSKLSIQNNIESLPEAEACVNSIAELIGFNSHDNKQIQLALEEVLTNIIKHSFAPDQLEDIKIDFQQIPLGLKISIWVKGIPFNPELFPVYSRKDLEEQYNDRGLGTFLIREIMDEYAYINHGHEGMEVILSKHFPSESIEDLIMAGKAEAIPELSEKRPKVQYTIGPMQVEEAVEVSRLAYYAYGYTYPYENIYYPDRIVRLNEDGSLISYLARMEDDIIIGHSALIWDSLSDKNVEIGIAFSNPEFRGMGIMNRLWEALIEKAKADKVCGIFAMTVTTHPYSQKAAHHFGMKDCALLVSKVPILKFNNIEEKEHARESIMIAYRFLNPPKQLRIYPPERHHYIIKRIYEKLGFLPKLMKPELNKDELKGMRTKLVVKPDTAFITAKIQVIQYGEHTVKKVNEDLKQFCVERYETIYLSLILEDPYTALLTPEFENLGFFFSGVQPGDEGNNQLVLQYLHDQVVDYSLLRLDDEFGKELADYVKKCDPN
jgi:serine/threonine-protein kinase RsbW